MAACAHRGSDVGLQMDRHPLGGGLYALGKPPGVLEGFLVGGFGESQNCWETVAVWVLFLSSRSLMP